ncbi:MAG: type IV pilus twitching motility protein PilT [Candidatus Omnitrophica bacterium]|nr:type IV pilus twitching motility protein PilT [Candidatus Omnitrophota bacterium]
MDDKIRKLLEAMPAKNASDLHISAESQLHYRINNDLVKIGEEITSPEESKRMAYSLMSEDQIRKFEEHKEMDFAFFIKNVSRFRANVFLQRGHVGCAIRMIPIKIRSISECGLPESVLKDFCRFPKGLVLVTGATGSGKSTTLAAMVNEINKTRKCHIVTVEDPIEYVHHNISAVIDQREVGFDTLSFNNSLRHVLRQDPDVILIGELRDYESIQSALVIADTGHLVLGTLHTSDSIQTINRIVDVFPAHQQKQIRTQLSFVLLGIVSQQLITNKTMTDRVLAAEILVVTPPIRNMIRDERVHHIYSTIQTSQRLGMKTMNQSLLELYKKDIISYDDALSRSQDVEELMKLIG